MDGVLDTRAAPTQDDHACADAMRELDCIAKLVR